MVKKSEINQFSILNNNSIGRVNEGILKPKYDSKLVSPGIVHIGVGNFHRAHQAYYINEYLNQSNDLKWGIIGVNLRSSESKNLEKLKNNNGKYILKTISTNSEEKYTEIHSLIELYDWNKNPNSAESIFTNGNIELVTMTVTESGYYIKQDNKLNLDLSIVKNNIARKEKSIIFSYLHRILTIRMNECNKPITLLCCDNIRENGIMLKSALKDYIKACEDVKLLAWIDANVSFPSCVVDRITPRSPDNLAKEIKNKFNFNDQCSVMAEPFIQWVVEDNFKGKRPKLEKVGVQFVKDVFPYEESKIRILNGGHLALSYFGVLKGLKTYDEAINDKELLKFFFNLEKKEIIPALGNEIPFDLEKYMLVIYNRFKNKNIGDKFERLVMDGVSKFPIMILPTIRICFEKKIIPSNAISSIAAWYVFMKKIYTKELNFDYYEPQWDWIKQFLNPYQIQEFVSCVDLWGDVPKQFPEFKLILKEKIKKIG